MLLILIWFENNYFKINAEKCKLLVSKNVENVSIVIDGHTIFGTDCVLLGVNIDNKLDFNHHISTIYKKPVLSYMVWQESRISLVRKT